MKFRNLYTIIAVCMLASLLLSSCAALAPAATSTPLPPTRTPKPTVTSTSTPKPTVTPLPTATPNLAATQQVEAFAAKVKEYYDAKYVSTTDGTYTNLGYYSQEWAKLNYYQWKNTGFSPTDFILSSDITWDSASSAADSSGCGFVFRIQDNYDHYMIYLSLKGYVEAAANISNNWNGMGTGTFALPAQHGKATMTLIVEGKMIRALVNDKLVKVYTGLDGKLMQGNLAYTVLSGTNKSFGTSCMFQNTELWTIIHQ